MSTTPSVSVAVSIADAVKAQVRTYGQTTAMIKAVYAAEGMACGPTLAEVVAILLDPRKSKGGESDRVTFYETFRKTAQRAIGDDCLLPPVFLLDKSDNSCRVILLAKDVTLEQVKAAGLPTREENKALMAVMLRDKPASKAQEPEAAPEASKEDAKEAPAKEPAPAAATDFDKLVTLLSGLDATQVRELIGAIGVVNPAQLVVLGDSVNTALKAAGKQVAAATQLQAYKSAAPNVMSAPAADLSATAPANAVPSANVVAAAMANAKPTRKAGKSKAA